MKIKFDVVGPTFGDLSVGKTFRFQTSSEGVIYMKIKAGGEDYMVELSTGITFSAGSAGYQKIPVQVLNLEAVATLEK